MEDNILGIVVILILMLLISAYFSASETAFTGLNRSRLKTMANEGDKKAVRALNMAENYDRLLYTTLIGNNVVNIFATSLATTLFVSLFPQSGVLYSTVVMSAAILLFGEITPKSFAKQSPEDFAIFSTPLMRFFAIVFWPLNFLFSLWLKLMRKIFTFDDNISTTEDELITIVDEAEADGGIGPMESELIRSAIEFNDLDVEDILTPRIDVVAVEENDSIEKIEEVFVANSFSRLPVYRQSIDFIIGVIHEKDFLAQKHYNETSIKPIIKNIIYASPTMKISTLLRILQKSKSHLAVVLDEFGGTEGIVTLEDILEELVGEIWDEHDEVIEPIVVKEDNTVIAAGSANLEDMFDILDVNSSHFDYDAVTVNGWIIEVLDKIPKSGEVFIADGLKVTVLHADEKVVQKAEIELLEQEEE